MFSQEHKHSWMMGFKFVKMKGHNLFQMEIIMNSENTLTKVKKSSSQEPPDQFQPNLAQRIIILREFNAKQITHWTIH